MPPENNMDWSATAAWIALAVAIVSPVITTILLFSSIVDYISKSLRIGCQFLLYNIKTTSDTYGHLYPDKDMKLASRKNQLRPKIQTKPGHQINITE